MRTQVKPKKTHGMDHVMRMPGFLWFRRRVAERVRVARWRAELTQEEVAARTGLCSRYVAEIERCKRNPTLCTLFMLAEALNVSLSDLVSVRDVVSVDLDTCRGVPPPQAWQDREVWTQLAEREGLDADKLIAESKMQRAVGSRWPLAGPEETVSVPARRRTAPRVETVLVRERTANGPVTVRQRRKEVDICWSIVLQNRERRSLSTR